MPTVLTGSFTLGITPSGSELQKRLGLCERVESSPMRVRYHPRKPDVSVWREQEQVEKEDSISMLPVRAEYSVRRTREFENGSGCKTRSPLPLSSGGLATERDQMRC